ncbi:MAG: hypothetical protein HS128_12440 [Ideonella sp.]|nr:hypothetical protein [Ideonella sp.]
MIAFIALLLVLAWAAFSLLFAYNVARFPKRIWLRGLVGLIAFGILMPFPVIDEILAKPQFERLCRENAEIKIDRASAVGRTVYFEAQPHVELPGTWVQVTRRPMRYVDATTGELVLSYNVLEASGGVLVHLLGAPGKVPLLFRYTCMPKDPPAGAQAFKALGINYVEPPKNRRGEKK